MQLPKIARRSMTAVVALAPFMLFGAGVHPAGASLSISQVWGIPLPDAGAPIANSSPNVAQLAGGPAVVVGDRAGHVYALSLSNGSTVPGWPFSTGGVPIDSTPSVWTPPGSSIQDVFVGVGNSGDFQAGGYQAIAPNGTSLWTTTVPWTPGSSTVAGVQASLAVGSLQGQTSVVAGSLGQYGDALNASNGGALSGFPWFQADSEFSTPAIADLYGNGRNEIVEGGDSTAGNAYGIPYQNGGHLRVLSDTGNAGTGNPSGGLVCEYNTDQTVQSSPAVGRFLSGGATGIVFGTSFTYAGATTTDELLAVDPWCNLQWAARLDGLTTSSPALADVLGNGQLQVVEGTNAGNGTGSVWVLNGANGQPIWHAPVSGEVIGSVVTADLTNSGHQDVIVPTTSGVQIFDGASGALLTTIGTNYGFQNSPLVTDDPNGTIGITIAGYNGATNSGVVLHYEVAGSTGSNAHESGGWPMFHHDPQLTGTVGAGPGEAGPFFEFLADHANGRVWNAYDQSTTANGPMVVGRPSALSDPRDGLLHVFAEGATGDLVEYVNDGANGRGWNAYDLSSISGSSMGVADPPDAIYDNAQGVLHVYAQAPNGDLVEYVNDNAGGRAWNVYDQSVGAGGGGTIWGTPSAVTLGGIVHVYVQGAWGHLIEYVNDGANGRIWNAYDQTAASGGGAPLASSPAAVVLGSAVHVYVQSAWNNDLVEYVNDGANGRIWNAYDHTAVSGGGAPLASSPAAVVFGSAVHVYVQSVWNHDLVEYVNDGANGRIWNAYDQSASSGGPNIVSGATAVALGGVMHVYAPAG